MLTTGRNVKDTVTFCWSLTNCLHSLISSNLVQLMAPSLCYLRQKNFFTFQVSSTQFNWLHYIEMWTLSKNIYNFFYRGISLIHCCKFILFEILNFSTWSQHHFNSLNDLVGLCWDYFIIVFEVTDFILIYRGWRY